MKKNVLLYIFSGPLPVFAAKAICAHEFIVLNLLGQRFMASVGATEHAILIQLHYSFYKWSAQYTFSSLANQYGL